MAFFKDPRPSFCSELERRVPGLWVEFSSHQADLAQPWSSKLDGDIPCLDRDWRKIAFRLFDFLLASRGFLDPQHIPHGNRLETIVHPVRIVFARTSSFLLISP